MRRNEKELNKAQGGGYCHYMMQGAHYCSLCAYLSHQCRVKWKESEIPLLMSQMHPWKFPWNNCFMWSLHDIQLFNWRSRSYNWYIDVHKSTNDTFCIRFFMRLYSWKNVNTDGLLPHSCNLFFWWTILCRITAGCWMAVSVNMKSLVLNEILYILQGIYNSDIENYNWL